MLFNQLSKKRILENKITTFLSITEIKSPLFSLTHLKSKKNWHQQGRPILPPPHPARSHLRSNHHNATLPQCRVAPWCDRATNPTVLTVPTPPHCHPARSADATLPTLPQCRVAPWCDRATLLTATRQMSPHRPPRCHPISHICPISLIGLISLIRPIPIHLARDFGCFCGILRGGGAAGVGLGGLQGGSVAPRRDPTFWLGWGIE